MSDIIGLRKGICTREASACFSKGINNAVNKNTFSLLNTTNITQTYICGNEPGSASRFNVSVLNYQLRNDELHLYPESNIKMLK
jgi:hypothetical protein